MSMYTRRAYVHQRRSYKFSYRTSEGRLRGVCACAAGADIAVRYLLERALASTTANDSARLLSFAFVVCLMHGRKH